MKDTSAVSVVKVTGSLDFYSSPRLLRRVKKLADGPIRELALDLAEVRSVDVSGMALILTASRLLDKRGKRLVLGEISPAVRRAFALLNLRLTSAGMIESDASGRRAPRRRAVGA